ncbi:MULTISPECIES: hypothetical protein [unclassified Rhodococcus (in: high G+C Gram-positive bacteria)]|uniref:hypothetical protein n=1 Tax=unclassified Rhodococcus (in: high G+C Gram-positive bacteria) TaxID=192944 RepID=UPI00117A02C1|nr:MULTISPECIES: hypothetical protein [unclassified Rhodococcus (in: high G+C Gram-positive bacteria)]
MKPTVGRVVLYHPHETQARYAGLPPAYPSTPHAALVTFANPTVAWVELVVFPPRGSTYTVSACEGRDDGEWSWPPRV